MKLDYQVNYSIGKTNHMWIFSSWKFY